MRRPLPRQNGHGAFGPSTGLTRRHMREPAPRLLVLLAVAAGCSGSTPLAPRLDASAPDTAAAASLDATVPDASPTDAPAAEAATADGAGNAAADAASALDAAAPLDAALP